MHGSLGATAEAAAGRTFAAEEIEEVVVTVPAAGVSLVLEPADAKVAPRSEYEGKFSLQYSTAAMLVRGHVGVSDYTDEAITDPAVLAVAQKVRYETQRLSDLPAGVPRRRPRSGSPTARRSRPTSPTRRAVPRTRSRPDEVRAKFRGNASLASPDEALEALEEAILTIEEQDDLAAALAPVAAARGRRLMAIAGLTEEQQEIVAPSASSSTATSSRSRRSSSTRTSSRRSSSRR